MRTRVLIASGLILGVTMSSLSAASVNNNELVLEVRTHQPNQVTDQVTWVPLETNVSNIYEDIKAQFNSGPESNFNLEFQNFDKLLNHAGDKIKDMIGQDNIDGVKEWYDNTLGDKSKLQDIQDKIDKIDINKGLGLEKPKNEITKEDVQNAWDQFVQAWNDASSDSTIHNTRR